jgi:crotonobetainyl-CoA:carnitine CoA-transferase CaiB-like acyl-CoA transferase
MLQKTRDEWIPLLRKHGQWIVPVRNFEEICTEDTHLRDNGLMFDLDHPELGTSTFYGLPIKLSETPMTARKHAPSSASTPERYSRSLALARRRSASSSGRA